MNARVFSFALALIVLFSFNNTFAQKKGFKANPQINTAQGEPQLSGSYVDGNFEACIDFLRLTGLGDATSVAATFTIQGTGTVCCISPGQQKQEDPNCTPGQALSATSEPVNLPVENGNVIIRDLCALIVGTCKNQRNFDAEVQDVVITNAFVTVQGRNISLNAYLDQINNP